MKKDLLDLPVKRRLFSAAAILLCVGTVGYLVYLTGGTANAFTHFMYIPIILSAFYFGKKGAILTALLCGLVLGPWMPTNIEDGTMQHTVSWVIRMAIFLVIGLVAAHLFLYIRRARREELERSFVDEITGRPNEKKLRVNLMTLIQNKTEFSLLGFRITNLDQINQYTDYEIGIKSMLKAMDVLEGYVHSTTYSVFFNEFAAVILPGQQIDPCVVGRKLLNELKKPFKIDKFKIELSLKIGVVNYPKDAQDYTGLIKKMGISLGQEADAPPVVVYNSLIEQKNKERFELSTALFEAIENEELYLVYQPQLCLKDRSITRVEALLRWRHPVKGCVSPEVFIKMAEEIGLITEITRWVIKHVTEQLKRWQSEGVFIKVAINISGKDLRDATLVDFLKDTLRENALGPSAIEVELTEKAILHNAQETGACLNELRRCGGRVALDDFGTGYNSLLNLITIPTDYLKIDKYFVDNIFEGDNATLFESILAFAHKTGKKVIAEGVETREQLDRLRQLDCDYVQGYLISEPLLPQEAKAFCYKAGSGQGRDALPGCARVKNA